MARACWLCGSVRGVFRKGTMASAHLDHRHFSVSQNATGAFWVAILVLELIGSESVLSLYVGSLRRFIWTPEVSSTDSIPAGFCSQKLWGLIFLALETLAEGAGVGLGLFNPEVSLPNFYLPHVDVEPACSTSPPLLPVWMDVVSLILLVGCYFYSRISDCSEWWLF